MSEESGKAWCNSNGSWTEAKEIWVAEETTPGNFEWTMAWRAPDPPAGVTVQLTQEQFQDGPVEASWINNNSEYQIQVQWERNSTVFDNNFLSPSSNSDTQPEEEFSDGDAVRARMRYFEGSIFGDWGPWSDTLNYIGGFG